MGLTLKIGGRDIYGFSFTKCPKGFIEHILCTINTYFIQASFMQYANQMNILLAFRITESSICKIFKKTTFIDKCIWFTRYSWLSMWTRTTRVGSLWRSMLRTQTETLALFSFCHILSAAFSRVPGRRDFPESGKRTVQETKQRVNNIERGGLYSRMTNLDNNLSYP